MRRENDALRHSHAQAMQGRKAQMRWLVVNLFLNLTAICVDALALGEHFELALSIRMLLVTPVFLASIAIHIWSPSLFLRSSSTTFAIVIFISVIAGLAQFADAAFSSRYLMVAIFVVFVSALFAGLSWNATKVAGGLGWLFFSVLAVLNQNFQIAYMNVDLIFLCGSIVGLALLLRRRQDLQMAQIRAMRETDAARVHELNQANRRLAQLSYIDPLTGLFNRRRLEDYLEGFATSLVPSSGYGVLMIDVDHFKKLNDQSGHAEGDRCLRTLAKVISSIVRSDADIALRYGGEEFALILNDADATETLAVAERLRTAIVDLRFPNAGIGPHAIVTASIGAYAASPSDPIADALGKADDLLYVAKREGRNRVVSAEGAPKEAALFADGAQNATRLDDENGGQGVSWTC